MGDHFIDGVHGDDVLGDGSEGNPYQTLNKGYTVAVDNDWLMVQNGVYGESLLMMGKALNVRGLGSSVWIDGEYIRDYGIRLDDLHDESIIIQGIKLKNFVSAAFYHSMWNWLPAPGHTWGVVIQNCLVTDDDPLRRVARAAYLKGSSSSYHSYLFENCHFERVSKVTYTYNIYAHARNCIFREYTSLYDGSDKCVREAVGYPGAAGAGDVDITAFPPPYRDAANADYSIDPVGVNAAKFIGGGWNDGNIGIQGGRAHTFTSESPMIDFDGGAGGSAWINDDRCYDPSFPSTTIILGTNDKLDFDEGAGELTGAIAAAVYNTGATLATAIAVALNAVGVATFVVTWLSYLHFRIASDGVALTLKIATGTNKAIAAWSDIGFSFVADKIGGVSYDADYPVTVGASTAVGEGLELAITAALANNKLDFNEGGIELNATVADTTSNNPITICAAIKTAMEVVGADTYTVTYCADGLYSRKYKIKKDSGGTLNLKWATGANTGNTCGAVIGYDITADDNGATEYLADKATTSGPVTQDPSRRLAIDFAIESDARLGRGLSPIINKGAATPEWRNVEWCELDDVGQKRYLNADNAVGTVLSRSLEARANILTFVQGLADTGLARNFTQIERDTEMNWEEQFLQVRASLREVI